MNGGQVTRDELITDLLGTFRDWNDGDEVVASTGQVDDNTIGVEFEDGTEFFITVEEA
jgi:hypothetical protein